VLLLITGASGVGKSTVRAIVAPRLSPKVECVELCDLAPIPQAMTRVWRQQTAEAAVRRAVELQDVGRHLLLAGDPVPAVEIVAAPSAPRLDAIAVCLLDAAPAAQAQRLAARGDPPELLHHHHAYAEWMRRQASDALHMTHVVADGGWDEMRWERLEQLTAEWQMDTIDTTHMTITEVSDAVHDWCWRALAGAAPALRVASR
jgi:broad-specificity NMP kinase